MSRILIIEDEKNAREALQRALQTDEVSVVTAGTGEEGLERFREGEVQVVLTDVRLPGIDGLEVQRRLREHDPSVFVIVMTAYGTIEKAVQAMKEGAYQFIEKPLDLKTIRTVVRGALEDQQRLRQDLHPAMDLGEGDRFCGIIGRSPGMLEIFRTIDQVASARSTVLITGENGTGKELVARAIHSRSPRSDKPLVEVNLGASTRELIGDELFGHEPGAYTDAKARKVGVFERAAGGTLFLDEIGEIASDVQVKLLRVIQERRFERLGGTQTIEVDVRLIAATNKDLQAEVDEGRFREDLFYRIRVIQIRLPALRERHEDISLLVNHFVRHYAAENGRQVLGVSDEALALLERYRWPGNVRELENCIENAVVLSRDEVLGVELFPLEVRTAEITDDGSQLRFKVGTALSDVEKEMILRTLESVGGNKTHAARLLGISARTLYRKLDEYGK